MKHFRSVNVSLNVSTNKSSHLAGDCNLLIVFGVPYGSRTRVAAVKGRCPRPLDERDAPGDLLQGYRKRVTYRRLVRTVNLRALVSDKASACVRLAKGCPKVLV